MQLRARRVQRCAECLIRLLLFLYPDMFSQPDQSCIDAIHLLAIDVVQKTDSGHLGLPLGVVPIALERFAPLPQTRGNKVSVGGDGCVARASLALRFIHRRATVHT